MCEIFNINKFTFIIRGDILKTKILITLLAVIFILNILTSCDSKTNNTDNIYESLQELTPKQNIMETQSLTVYTWHMNDNVIKNMLSEFQNEYPEVKINYIMIQGSIWDYNDKLSNDLAAGDGPDLFIFTPNLIKNLSKLIKNNVFVDIDELNKHFNKLDYNDYYKIVFDSGLINSKRYFIPFDYSVPLMLGVEETLDKYNIMYKEDVTLKEFVKSTRNYYDSLNPTDNRYVFLSNFTQYTLYSIAGKKSVNMFVDEWILDEFEMSEVYEIINILYPDGNSALGKYYIDLNQYTDSDMGALHNENVLFYTGIQFNPSYISTLPTLNTRYDYIITNGKTPVLTTLPNIEGTNEVTASLNYILAINENSKNKESALNCIANMLDFKTQFTLSYTETSTATPINIDVFEYGINWFKENPTEHNNIYPVIRPYPQEFIDNYLDIINSINNVFTIDGTIGGFMIDEGYYIEIENKSINSAINDLNNKIKSYMQE